jgi:hypothetical protein
MLDSLCTRCRATHKMSFSRSNQHPTSLQNCEPCKFTVQTEYNTGRTVKYKIYTHFNKELILPNLQRKLIKQITMTFMM